MEGLGDDSMLVEHVWAALSEKRRQSCQALRSTLRLGEDSLDRVVDFFARSNLVDSSRHSKLRERRKPVAISPLHMVGLAWVLAMHVAKAPSARGRILAERVICHSCGGRDLILTGGNEVQCTQCAERQWLVIERLSV
jgi:hypothetical protein